MKPSRRKQSTKEHRVPNLPPAALLRSRLDGLWGNPAWPAGADDVLRGDLDDVIKSTPLSAFLPAMLKAAQDVPAETQARLDQLMPGWLRDHGYQADLATVADRLPDDAERRLAWVWLEVTGASTPVRAAEARPAPFYAAYFFGDDSQAILNIFWYKDRQRRRVAGMGFLLDYKPPWEGAVKDIMILPQREPRAAIREFVDSWAGRGMPLAPISAMEAKQIILEALESNRQKRIRLPRDLTASRDAFLRYVLSLPDGPATPLFTSADFEALSRTGEQPEQIMRFEQTVGRRVRMPDGKELLIMGGRGFDEDEEWP